MSRLAIENTVLFASPPFYVRDVLKDIRGNKLTSTGVTKVNDGLYTYVPPRWLPFSYRRSKVDTVLRQFRLWHIRKVMNRLGMRNPILYVWYPSFVDVIGEFNESLVVYHCYDEYASFTDQNQEEKEQIIRQEKQLLERAHIVFTASEELYERKRLFNSNTFVVRNAVDYKLFSQAQLETTKVPVDILAIPRPIIGCVATSTSSMDLALLREVFTAHPEWSFVFVGVENPDGARVDEELSSFQQLPNVYFIGRRRLVEIPHYLKACDVCVIPWILHDATLVSSSPLKLYEYLAAGKPVICKPLPLISYLDGVISFAEGKDEWSEAIERALRQENSEKIEERQAIARRNTWDQRVGFIATKLTEELSRRRD